MDILLYTLRCSFSEETYWSTLLGEMYDWKVAIIILCVKTSMCMITVSMYSAHLDASLFFMSVCFTIFVFLFHMQPHPILISTPPPSPFPFKSDHRNFPAIPINPPIPPPPPPPPPLFIYIFSAISPAL